MNESDYTRTIHDKLNCYHWKINAKFTNGVPDAYYSGHVSDLWIEYKWYPKGLPQRVLPKLSELQKKWLMARYCEDRNVAVVVGSPDLNLIYTQGSWLKRKLREDAIPREEVVSFIHSIVGINNGII